MCDTSRGPLSTYMNLPAASPATDERDQLQAVSGLESNFGVSSPRHDIQVALHRHLAASKTEESDEVGHRQPGWDLARGAVDRDFDGIGGFVRSRAHVQRRGRSTEAPVWSVNPVLTGTPTPCTAEERQQLAGIRRRRRPNGEHSRNRAGRGHGKTTVGTTRKSRFLAKKLALRSSTHGMPRRQVIDSSFDVISATVGTRFASTARVATLPPRRNVL